MKVRSFEIVEADLRQLHDYLLEVGGFQFRAGGAGFFVLVGERFFARSGGRHAHFILAQLEADTVSIDVMSAGGGGVNPAMDLGSSDWFLRQARELLSGFADRHGLEMIDLTAEP